MVVSKKKRWQPPITYSVYDIISGMWNIIINLDFSYDIYFLLVLSRYLIFFLIFFTIVQKQLYFADSFSLSVTGYVPQLSYIHLGYKSNK